jgi:1,2-diacylglycerol 3-alpha-glucosyltransferase
MTSFSTTETQGLTIIEALASSVPVICINDTSFREMVENNYNGYLFKDNKEFIKKVITLKENKDKYQEMTLNAKNSIYKYSKEVFASDILKVYSKALNEKNSKN